MLALIVQRKNPNLIAEVPGVALSECGTKREAKNDVKTTQEVMLIALSGSNA